VVAAGVDATGAPVLFSAVHIIYFQKRGYADESERAYFGEGRDKEAIFLIVDSTSC
jgi:hypothetical protein